MNTVSEAQTETKLLVFTSTGLPGREYPVKINSEQKFTDPKGALSLRTYIGGKVTVAIQGHRTIEIKVESGKIFVFGEKSKVSKDSDNTLHPHHG